MGPEWQFKHYWYRYADANHREACYACARGTNTYLSCSRAEAFRAHNGTKLFRPAEHYEMPLCGICFKVLGIKPDPPPAKPKDERTPKMEDTEFTLLDLP